MRLNPAKEALTRAVNRAIAEGSPVFVNRPAHRYELHRTNTHETDEHGRRYVWCVYDYFDVNGHKGISFWYFVTKRDALQAYPSAI